VPVVEIELSVKLNGQLLPSFPFRKRIQCNEAQTIATTKAGGDTVGVYVVLPGGGVVPAAQAFMVGSDQAVNLRVNNAGVIPLNAGGMLILIDGNVNAGAALNLQINNVGTNPANLTGFVAGS
jgi:hypothetical protein